MRRATGVAWRALTAACCLVPVAGCAMRSDIMRLERQMQVESARRDSITAAQLGQLQRLLQVVSDSQAAASQALLRLRADVRGELLGIQQSLVTVQELTGQSQQRLTEIRADLASRQAQAASDTTRPPGAASPGAAPPPAGTETPDQLLELSVQQLRRGSPGAARAGLAEFMRLYPAHARTADALYFTGEAWSAEGRNDSAVAAYGQVVRRFPQSPRAAASHYRIAMAALAAGRNTEARAAFERVVQQFPSSEEAALARERLRTLPARP